MNSQKIKFDEFSRGVFASVPILFGVFPFGLIFGVLGTEVGLTNYQAFFMSVIIFGGASQIVYLQLLMSGAGGSLIFGSVTFVNLRHVLYSASIAQFFLDLPFKWKILLSFLLTDEAYALTIRHITRNPKNKFKHYYFFGSGISLYFIWIISTFIGIKLGFSLPNDLGLSFAIPLTFIAVIAPYLKFRGHLAAACISGSITLIAQGLPFNSWLIIASLGGLIAGLIIGKNNITIIRDK